MDIQDHIHKPIEPTLMPTLSKKETNEYRKSNQDFMAVPQRVQITPPSIRQYGIDTEFTHPEKCPCSGTKTD